MTLRVALPTLAAAAALALAFGEDSAKAAVPSLGTSSPSTSWSGQFYAVPVVDPTLCLAGALDPTNLTCDHFSVDVAAAGTEQVAITWSDPANDFDLRVYDGAGSLVAESNGDGTTSESVTFPAAAGRYEVRVVPFLVVASGYQGKATWSSTPSSSRRELVKSRMDGGGLPLLALADDARFEMDVRTIATPNGLRFAGKVRFREGGIFFRSEVIADAVPEPHGTGSTGGSFLVDGTGTCNGQRGQPFQLTADDNGPGVADDFDLASSCVATGPRTFAKGDLRFRQQVGG